MALDSPIISDEDSLIEEVPMQTGEDFPRGNQTYSTFTRKRPTNLSSSSQRKKRQSLMSPQSIPNLDADDLLTPDFAMTQSMYEPLEKKKQQQKLEENTKLLKLIASEKSTQAAQDRKLKEIKKKAIENKKRNEEKQKLVEERRLRMLADQEAKKSRLMMKINLPSAVTTSYYGNMTKSVVKYKNAMGSGFMDKRPMSSTGRIFGFGSSAPREVCEKLSIKKSDEKDSSLLDIKRPEQPSSRMWTSQIVHSTNQRGDTKSKMGFRENSVKPMSSSIVSISSFNKTMIKKKKASTNASGENLTTVKMMKIKESSELKTPRLKNNINGLTKIQSPNYNHVKQLEKPRGRSVEKVRNSSSNITIIPELGPMPAERKKTRVRHRTMETSFIKSDKHKITNPEKPKSTTAKSDQVSSIKKRTAHNSEPKFIPSKIFPERQTEPSRKFEVRFEENENTKDDDANLISESSLSMERPRLSTSNLTEEEYKRRISLQRKLAKEKRRKQQEEREHQELLKQNETNVFKPIDIPNNENHATVVRLNSESSETNVEELKIDSPISSEQPNKDLEMAKVPKTPIITKESSSNDDSSFGNTENIPNIELTKSPIEMTASVEALDRIERKKRLSSIMSRIKKPSGGSTESVTHHMSSTTLQDMLDKGHLSGMSKAAAILMKSTNQTPDMSASVSDLPNPLAPRSSFSAMDLNSKSQEILATSENIEESRGSCDGQEDLNNNSNGHELLTTKSSLMDNLVSTPSKPYLSSWAEKYSDSYSLDTEDGSEK